MEFKNIFFTAFAGAILLFSTACDKEPLADARDDGSLVWLTECTTDAISFRRDKLLFRLSDVGTSVAFDYNISRGWLTITYADGSSAAVVATFHPYYGGGTYYSFSGLKVEESLYDGTPLEFLCRYLVNHEWPSDDL